MTTHLTKANAPEQGGVEAAKQSRQRRNFNAKSTAKEAQRERCLEELGTGPKTSYDLRRLGIYQAPARIIELRRAGFDIRTELVDLYDIDGYLHPRCARYHLHKDVA